VDVCRILKGSYPAKKQRSVYLECKSRTGRGKKKSDSYRDKSGLWNWSICAADDGPGEGTSLSVILYLPKHPAPTGRHKREVAEI